MLPQILSTKRRKRKFTSLGDLLCEQGSFNDAESFLKVLLLCEKRKAKTVQPRLSYQSNWARFIAPRDAILKRKAISAPLFPFMKKIASPTS